MEKKRGRPPKEKAKRKTRYLQVRVADAEKAAFDDAAALAGQDLSVWVRDRLRAIARRELEQSGRQVQFLKQKPQG